ncbi:MAG: tRNA (adenosine(37)-N6)-threonylcarbamoyltransferase complex dimerization subunit type 1 TsaB [Bacteroidota bacterium]
MAVILNIESATGVCSVAIGRDGQMLSLKEINEERTHAEVITVFIETVLKESGLKLKAIDAIAVSGGPGSYTGLRIGVSTAKGLCYALNKPLIAIPTLESMSYGVIDGYAKGLFKDKINDDAPDELLFCPMIDARRMEVYTSFFDIDNHAVKDTSADVIQSDSYAEWFENRRLLFFGDGSSKCKDVLSHQSNAIFLDDVLPSASTMILLSEDKFNHGLFEDLAYYEPFYLKNFVATKAKENT